MVVSSMMTCVRWASLSVVLSALLLATGGPSAKAAPMLLAQVNGDESGSHTSAGLLGTSATGAVLLFGYGFNSFSGGTQPLGLDLDLLLGADVTWPLGAVGNHDFNAGNSADFTQIAARLTDGTDDDLWTGGLVLLTGTAPGDLAFAGSVAAGFESGRLGASPDLHGATVDFIRLVVDEVYFELTPFSTVATLERRLGATWQIWGTPAPIAEPATLTLFGAGILGLGVMLRRRRRART